MCVNVTRLSSSLCFPAKFLATFPNKLISATTGQGTILGKGSSIWRIFYCDLPHRLARSLQPPLSLPQPLPLPPDCFVFACRIVMEMRIGCNCNCVLHASALLLVCWALSPCHLECYSLGEICIAFSKST